MPGYCFHVEPQRSHYPPHSIWLLSSQRVITLPIILPVCWDKRGIEKKRVLKEWKIAAVVSGSKGLHNENKRWEKAGGGERRTEERKGSRKNSEEKEEVRCFIHGGGEEKGRWERRTATIIALSYHRTVKNSLLVWELVSRLGPGLMTNHLHPALRRWLFMIRQLIRAGQGASWVSSGVGVFTPGIRWQPQMWPFCHVLTSPPLPPPHRPDSCFSMSSAGY